MTPVEENLLSVLRSELWQTPLQLSLSPKEAKELLDEAREHAVETIAARALVDNNIPIGKQLVPRCLYALQYTREGNDHLNAELARFASFIERQGLSLAVVKGQVSGTFYAHPEVRNPGDVDFYCDAENFPRVKEVVEKQIGRTIPDSKGKHINFQGNGVEYEMHSRLTDFYYAPHQRYFNAVVDKALRERPMRVKINGVDIPTLPPPRRCRHSAGVRLGLFAPRAPQRVGHRLTPPTSESTGNGEWLPRLRLDSHTSSRFASRGFSLHADPERCPTGRARLSCRHALRKLWAKNRFAH